MTLTPRAPTPPQRCLGARGVSRSHMTTWIASTHKLITAVAPPPGLGEEAGVAWLEWGEGGDKRHRGPTRHPLGWARRLDLVLDHVGDGLDKVRGALHHGLLHARGIGHGRVVHAQPLHRRVQLVEELLRDARRHGGTHAARLGAFVEDDDAVCAAKRVADGVHVKRLEAAELDEVDVEAKRLQLLHRRLRLFDAVQVREHRHRLARRHRRV
mmetsp:Transcript_51423/g.134286  ORF Transcript_51423/g.134286 Transcript_51423/m.134286 type:complete len:212 (+) Transcript_51423:199-834(+)